MISESKQSSIGTDTEVSRRRPSGPPAVQVMDLDNRRKSRFLIGAVVLIILVFLLLLLVLGYRAQTKTDKREQVVIAVSYSDWVQDFETNYYTSWLEKETGYDITFAYLEEGYERESLRALLDSESSGVDAVFLPAGQEYVTFEEYEDFIREGFLCAPETLLFDSRLSRLRVENPNVDFTRLLGKDGRFYCFPAVKMSQALQNMQVLWINKDWLTACGLTIPKTTEEFCDALLAFRSQDPNGNGVRDEIPLVSCEAEDALKSYRFLLNAFTYYDGTGMTLVSEGKATDMEALRDGIRYCRALYEQGLFVKDTFTYTGKQMMELVNDPADLVGAFSSHSIADVVYTNNPGILAHFMQLAPLSSPVSEKGYAVSTNIYPDIGGLIPIKAPHKEAAAQIMDLMLSKDASLIALYGEEGVDWRFSKGGELSTYGTGASVTTIHYLKGERQNKHYMGAGPMAAPAEYIDGVTWNGDHSMTEYIDARAVKVYEAYYVPEIDGSGRGSARHSDGMSGALDDEILRFITGERDVENAKDWEAFLLAYRAVSE